MEDILAVYISLAALLVSLAHLWWAHGRRGALKMTRPTVVYLGPDSDVGSPPKIFLRTLLFSTAQRGCVIENMYARVTAVGISQFFTYWGYFNPGEPPFKGSGLFVGPQGCTYNHNFVVPKSASAFQFPVGTLQIEVFAQILGRTKPIRVQAFSLIVPQKSDSRETRLMFDWNPELQAYDCEPHSRPSRQNEDSDSVELLAAFSIPPAK